MTIKTKRGCMVDSISGGGNVDPHNQQIYKQDFTKGAELFKQSLEQYQSSSNPLQKEAFKDVMSKAMNVMNETAKLCLSKEAQKKEAQLNDAFNNFQNSENPETIKDLSKSINSLKRTL